jgi:hypothetical protein
MRFSRKDCIYSSHVELSGSVNCAFLYARRLGLIASAFALVLSLGAQARGQEALVASVSSSATVPDTSIAPEQSIDLTSDINPPLPVASTDATLEHTPATSVDSGIPRRFHYQFRVAVRGVYDDNINLQRTNATSDYYFTIEPSLMLGFGDIETRTDNYIRLDYLPAVFIFADHDENNSVQHVIRLDGQYHANRLTLSLSQIVQIMDGVDVQGVNSEGGLDQQVNLDIAGRTRFDVFSTHLNIAYYLTGKTFLSSGAEYTRNYYPSLISSETFSANVFLNYNLTPKVVLGLGGTFGQEHVDEPNPDQDFEQINVRFSYQATGKIDFAASAGVEFRHFEGDLTDQHVSPIFEIGVNYAPFDGTKISLTANSRVLNSAVLASQNYVVTNLTAGIQQRLLQRVVLGFNGGYEHSDYFGTAGSTGPSRNDNYFFVQPSIAVSVTRYWTVGAYYLHRVNDSSFDAFSFHDNQVGLRSTLEF